MLPLVMPETDRPTMMPLLALREEAVLRALAELVGSSEPSKDGPCR